MITSISKQLCAVNIPSHDGEIKMLPFDMADLNSVPEKFRSLVDKMISYLPFKEGISFLTVDGKELKKDSTHRRGGVHIDGNFIPSVSDWGNSGGWKVGEGARVLSSEHHKISYESNTGGMLIASTYPACKGFNGIYDGKPYVGGDCTRLQGLNEGFMLEANTVYYGNSQFLHESLPVDKDIHRTLVRITLPMDYPLIND